MGVVVEGGMLVGGGRSRRSGQALVEFALIAFAFLLVMFATVLAAFHSIQRAMAETAAAAGVQVAASGTLGQADRPHLAGAFVPTRDLLRTVMFSTAIVEGPAGQACPALGSIAPATLEVCAYTDGELIAETVRGHPNLLIPAALADLLPFSIDVTVEMHSVAYQP